MSIEKFKAVANEEQVENNEETNEEQQRKEKVLDELNNLNKAVDTLEFQKKEDEKKEKNNDEFYKIQQEHKEKVASLDRKITSLNKQKDQSKLENQELLDTIQEMQQERKRLESIIAFKECGFTQEFHDVLQNQEMDVRQKAQYLRNHFNEIIREGINRGVSERISQGFKPKSGISEVSRGLTVEDVKNMPLEERKRRSSELLKFQSKLMRGEK